MANEKRLIDANALIEDLKWLKSVVNEFSKNEVQDYIDRVETSPTVDAVEVVRCKDCKYWDKDALWCDINSPQLSESHMNWYEDDFCSAAERKGDGNA